MLSKLSKDIKSRKRDIIALNIIDTYVCNTMQLRIAVLKFPYSFFSKQGKRVKIAKVAVNRNEIYFVKRMIHTFIVSCILTCSYDTSFLARILVIRDGDVESNPGPSDIGFSIKKQETLRVRGRPRKSGFKGKCTKNTLGARPTIMHREPIGSETCA